ncbi:hypothetical protein Tco_1210808 [Tanacetum coccineum]
MLVNKLILLYFGIRWSLVFSRIQLVSFLVVAVKSGFFLAVKVCFVFNFGLKQLMLSRSSWSLVLFQVIGHCLVWLFINLLQLSIGVGAGNLPSPFLIVKLQFVTVLLYFTCFDLIGYPPGYNRNPAPRPNNFRPYSANNASPLENGAPLSFTNDQMMKLMNLINDVPSGSNTGNRQSNFWLSAVFSFQIMWHYQALGHPSDQSLDVLSRPLGHDEGDAASQWVITPVSEGNVPFFVLMIHNYGEPENSSQSLQPVSYVVPVVKMSTVRCNGLMWQSAMVGIIPTLNVNKAILYMAPNAMFLVTWKSKKQSTLVQVSAEANIEAWLLLLIAANPVFQRKAKHFEIGCASCKERKLPVVQSCQVGILPLAIKG